MNKSESKFHNAAVKMQNALVALLEKQEFEEISIMQICEKAGVNRSTFYAHYDNTYDLLKEAQEEMIGHFMSETDFNFDIKDMSKMDADDLNFITPQFVIPYLNYIKKHKRLFKIYSKHAVRFEVNDMDKLLLENICVPIYQKHGIHDKRLLPIWKSSF